jgi:xanthine dehydrogenase accessory factor
MNEVLVSKPTPVRALATDDPVEVLRFAVAAFGSGNVALATLVQIRGGAARALGAHMAIAEDGRFCGYVSGGCVEAAVASETLLAMEEGRDRTVRFGDGSPFFDIVLPCGGGITVAIHLLRDIDALRDVLAGLNQRQPTALAYSPEQGRLVAIAPTQPTGWSNNRFLTCYRPKTRVMISGQAIEAEMVSRIAEAAGYEIARGTREMAVTAVPALIDPYTAVVLLHHDLEIEMPVLEVALASSAFYIGALGSTRTHRNRVQRLELSGTDRQQIDRIKAPIGMFGPTKDATALALSVLADIAAARLVADK